MKRREFLKAGVALPIVGSLPANGVSMWTQSSDKLPPEGKYVLGRYNGGNWHDSTDQENVNVVVVKLECGLEWANNGNNIPAYRWHSSSMNHFGQDITEWHNIP